MLKTWRDRMLVWHDGDFNNQSTIVIPGGQLWIPDLQVMTDCFINKESKFNGCNQFSDCQQCL